MDFAVQSGSQTSVLPKRRESRLPASLNVRVLGIDANGKPFHQPAVTLDISLSGVRITGLMAELKQGDIVGLQSGGDKCRFKVAWILANRDGSFQAGLQCTEKAKSPWRERLQREKTDGRRADERFACNGSVSLRTASFPTPIWGTLRDVGAGGCYVQAVNVAPVGDFVTGQFTINGVQINGVAEVRSSRVNVGMGLLWCDLGWDGQKKLDGILRTFAVNHSDANTTKQQALGQVEKLHQLVVAVRDRLEGNHPLVDLQMLSTLGEAQEHLMAVLKKLQR